MLQLKDLAALNVSPQTKIVRAEEYQSLVNAQQVIDLARQEAARIVASAQAEFERQKAAGYEDGLAAGRMEMIDKMIDSVGRSVDYFSGVEKSIVDIVMKALRKILGEMDDRERVVQVVRSALAVARNQRNVLVRVHPSEAESVRSQIQRITSPYPGVRFLEVTPDARLQPGACVLESEVGVVDAGIDVQLAAIEKSLSRSLIGAEQSAS